MGFDYDLLYSYACCLWIVKRHQDYIHNKFELFGKFVVLRIKNKKFKWQEDGIVFDRWFYTEIKQVISSK